MRKSVTKKIVNPIIILTLLMMTSSVVLATSTE